jgi:hypothetical protein
LDVLPVLEESEVPFSWPEESSPKAAEVESVSEREVLQLLKRQRRLRLHPKLLRLRLRIWRRRRVAWPSEADYASMRQLEQRRPFPR